MATTQNFVWTFDPNLPRPTQANLSPGWQQKLVPPGSVIRWLPAETYLPGQESFTWYKVYLGLPAQKFKITYLCDDGTWMEESVNERFDGPVGYKALNFLDGSNITARIEAV